MRQARAANLPNETLYIEEIKFWLKIMQEHTKFIRAGLPDEATDSLDEVKEFNRAFSSLMQKAERLKSVKQSGAFIAEICSVMEEFCRYQRKILAVKLCCKLGGSNFPFFLDHVLREAQCFLDLLKRMQGSEAALKVGAHTREVVIWLRFMADHTKLICHYLDPSERRVSKLAAEFSELFDNLVLEGRDLASMLYCQKAEIRAFHRFLLDVRMDVQRLRDFKKMAEDLISDCRLLGIMSVDLAAHMKREAEHCLLMIALMEKEIVKHCPDVFKDDIDLEMWSERERMEDFFDEAHGQVMPEREEAITLPEETNLVQVSMADERTESIAEPEYTQAVPEAVLAPPKEVALPLEEPVIAILSPEAAAGVMEKHREVIPQNEDHLPQAEEAGKKEKLYAKASDYKYMPNKLAGKTPGERCAKSRKEQRLPRSLGKVKS